jgi:hypothetical protein
VVAEAVFARMVKRIQENVVMVLYRLKELVM